MYNVTPFFPCLLLYRHQFGAIVNVQDNGFVFVADTPAENGRVISVAHKAGIIGEDVLDDYTKNTCPGCGSCSGMYIYPDVPVILGGIEASMRRLTHYDYVPRSIYGKIVAEADRIIDPDITLRRTVQYGLSNYPELDKEKQYIRFLAHLKEKYAEGGYLRLWIPQSANAVHLQELRQLIADEEELHKVFEKIYSQETETIQNLENIPIFVRNKKNNSI